MSAVRQRARIARVRRIQHDLASLASAKAAGHVQLLESNHQRLAQVGRGLSSGPGLTSGASLAGRGELAMRLEAARDGLGRTIAGARQAAALREQARIGARREQESADKLEQRAVRAAARAAERRSGAIGRPRKPGKGGEE